MSGTTMRTNLKSVYWLPRAFIPRMVAAGGALRQHLIRQRSGREPESALTR
jgi:hypothetical protein